MTTKEAWMIQVQFEDKSLESCPIKLFKRKLKGSGVEVDITYTPVRVAPGRFVGRGFVTHGVKKKLQRSWAFSGTRMSGSNINFFKELKPALERSESRGLP